MLIKVRFPGISLPFGGAQCADNSRLKEPCRSFLGRKVPQGTLGGNVEPESVYEHGDGLQKLLHHRTQTEMSFMFAQKASSDLQLSHQHRNAESDTSFTFKLRFYKEQFTTAVLHI